MAQLGQKAGGGGDVVPVAVSLDHEKPPLAGYAVRLGKAWTLLSEYKGYDSRAAKDYGVRGLARHFVIDARGRLRLDDTFLWLTDDYVAELRVEAFWAKKRGKQEPAAPAAAASPASEQASPVDVRWIFHLKSGGMIKAVSYEEAGGKYVLKLPSGTSTLPREVVERIAPADTPQK